MSCVSVTTEAPTEPIPARALKARAALASAEPTQAWAAARARLEAAEAAVEAATEEELEDRDAPVTVERHEAFAALIDMRAPNPAAAAYKLFLIGRDDVYGNGHTWNLQASLDEGSQDQAAVASVYLDLLAFEGRPTPSGVGAAWAAYQRENEALHDAWSVREQAAADAGEDYDQSGEAAEADALDQAHFGGLCTSADDADARLRYVALGMKAFGGETGLEGRVLESVIAFLSGPFTPPACGVRAEFERLHAAYRAAEAEFERVSAEQDTPTGGESDEDKAAWNRVNDAVDAAFEAFDSFAPSTIEEVQIKTQVRFDWMGHDRQQLLRVNEDLDCLRDGDWYVHPGHTHPDADLLNLSWAMEQAWIEEDRAEEDKAAEAATTRTGEIARAVMSTPAMSHAGYRAKARAIAWAYGGPEELLDHLSDDKGTWAQFTRQMLAELLSFDSESDDDADEVGEEAPAERVAA